MSFVTWKHQHHTCQCLHPALVVRSKMTQEMTEHKLDLKTTVKAACFHSWWQQEFRIGQIYKTKLIPDLKNRDAWVSPPSTPGTPYCPTVLLSNLSPCLISTGQSRPQPSSLLLYPLNRSTPCPSHSLQSLCTHLHADTSPHHISFLPLALPWPTIFSLHTHTHIPSSILLSIKLVNFNVFMLIAFQ